MLVRALLESLLIFLVARAVWRIGGGILQGMTAPGQREQQPRVPARGVHMERDPVCGTFVVPDPALSIVDGRARVFFCSTTCRDKFRARTA